MSSDVVRELYEVRKDLLRGLDAGEIGWSTAFEELYLQAARKLLRVTEPTQACPKCGVERGVFPACAQDGCPFLFDELS